MPEGIVSTIRLDKLGAADLIIITAIAVLLLVGGGFAFDAFDYDGNWQAILNENVKEKTTLSFPDIKSNLTPMQEQKAVYFAGYNPRHTALWTGKRIVSIGTQQMVQMVDGGATGPAYKFDYEGDGLHLVVCTQENWSAAGCIPYYPNNDCDSDVNFQSPYFYPPDGNITCTFDINETCSTYDPYCVQYHWGRLFDGTLYSIDNNTWNAFLPTFVYDSNALGEVSGIGHSPMEVYSNVKDGNLIIDLNIQTIPTTSGADPVCDINWRSGDDPIGHIIYEDLNMNNENLEHIKPFSVGNADMVLDLRWDMTPDSVSYYNSFVWDRSASGLGACTKYANGGYTTDWNVSGWSGSGAFTKKSTGTNQAGYYLCDRGAYGTAGLDGDGSDMNFVFGAWFNPSMNPTGQTMRPIAKNTGIILQLTPGDNSWRPGCYVNLVGSAGSDWEPHPTAAVADRIYTLEWSHVGCSWEGAGPQDLNTLCVYVNGVKSSCVNRDRDIMTDNDLNMIIGTSESLGNAGSMFGSYDDVFMYSSVKDGEFIMPTESDWNNYYQGQIAQRYCGDWNSVITTFGTVKSETTKTQCSVPWNTSDPLRSDLVGDHNEVFIDVACNVPTGSPATHDRSTSIGVTIDNTAPTFSNLNLDGDDWSADGYADYNGNAEAGGTKGVTRFWYDVNDFLINFPQEDFNLITWKTGAAGIWLEYTGGTMRMGLAHSGEDANIIRICAQNNDTDRADWDASICLQDLVNPEDCVVGTLHGDEYAREFAGHDQFECTNWFEYPYTGQTDHNYLISVHTERFNGWMFHVANQGGSGWFFDAGVDGTLEELVALADYTTGGYIRTIEFDIMVEGKRHDEDINMCKWSTVNETWANMDNNALSSEVLPTGVRSVFNDFGYVTNRVEETYYYSCRDEALNETAIQSLDFNVNCYYINGSPTVPYKLVVDRLCIMADNPVNLGQLYINAPLGEVRVFGQTLAVTRAFINGALVLDEGGQIITWEHPAG